jgi:hypothetical protein
MKIELQKKIDASGDVYFKITKDGEYVPGTTTMNEEIALDMLQRISIGSLPHDYITIKEIEIP